MLGHNNCNYDYKCNQEDLMILIILCIWYMKHLFYIMWVLYIVAWNSLVAWEILHMMDVWDTFLAYAILYCVLVWGAWIGWYVAMLSDPQLILVSRGTFFFSYFIFTNFVFLYDTFNHFSTTTFWQTQLFTP